MLIHRTYPLNRIISAHSAKVLMLTKIFFCVCVLLVSTALKSFQLSLINHCDYFKHWHRSKCAINLIVQRWTEALWCFKSVKGQNCVDFALSSVPCITPGGGHGVLSRRRTLRWRKDIGFEKPDNLISGLDWDAADVGNKWLQLNTYLCYWTPTLLTQV